MHSEVETKVKSSSKTVLVVLIVTIFFVLAGLLLALGKYYKILQNTNTEVADRFSKRVELGKMEQAYIRSFKEIIGPYLTQAQNLSGSVLVAKTQVAKEKMLGLLVPATFKQQHLTAVLDLSAIEDLAGKSSGVTSALNNLEDLLTKLK